MDKLFDTLDRLSPQSQALVSVLVRELGVK